VDNMRALLEQMVVANHAKVVVNLQQAEELSRVQSAAQASRAQLQQKSDAYKAELARLEAEFGGRAEDAVRELTKKQERLDEESEALGGRFVDGEVDLRVFMEEYLELRTRHHEVANKLVASSRGVGAGRKS
jgi:uncharacterized protein YPO0396